MVRLPPPIVGVTPGVAEQQGVDGLLRQVEVAVAGTRGACFGNTLSRMGSCSPSLWSVAV